MDREENQTAKEGGALRSLHISHILMEHEGTDCPAPQVRNSDSLMLFAMVAEIHRLSELRQKGCIHVPVPSLA